MDLEETLAGIAYNSGTITSSFWDTEVAGEVDEGDGVGLTTIEMQDINTFLNAGWDFVGESDNGTEDIWMMPEGPGDPILRPE